MRKNSDQGFTMLEMAIAITILGILMISVSQLLNSQIRLYDTATRHNELEQKARVSMMHILDEIRLHKSTYFVPGPDNKGIYATVAVENAPDESRSLVNINPIPDGVPPTSGIYFKQGEHSLWYRDPVDGKDYLISDEIHSIEIDQVPSSSRLVRINIIAKDERTGDEFQLLSWSRLY